MTAEQTNLLTQLLQAVNEGDPNRSHIDKLCAIRHMLSPKEQKIIDLMTKFNEIIILLDEIKQEK